MGMLRQDITNAAQPVCFDALEQRVFLSADASSLGLLAAPAADTAGTLSMMIGIHNSASGEPVGPPQAAAPSSLTFNGCGIDLDEDCGPPVKGKTNAAPGADLPGADQSLGGMLIQPDGPMPQAAAPGCGPPVEETSEAADVDGDGKLSLNDVKTNAAGEPTSLTFNGRGIDLNEDAKVDSLASADGAEPHGVHRPDSIDIDMLLIGKVLSNAGSAPTAGEIEFQGSYVVDLLSTEVDELAGSADGQVTLAYEPVWFSGAQAYLRGRVVDCLDGQAMRDGVLTKYEQRQLATTIAYEPVWAIGTGPDFNGRGIDLNEDAMVDSLGGEPTADLASRPIIEDILGSTEDFEYEGPADMPVMPQERPILEIVLGSTGDYEYTSEDQAPVASQAAAGYDGPDLYKYFEVDASRGGAGHCKIMAVRAANPESAFAAGGPLGAVMGGIGSILGGGGMLGKMLGPFA